MPQWPFTFPFRPVSSHTTRHITRCTSWSSTCLVGKDVVSPTKIFSSAPFFRTEHLEIVWFHIVTRREKVDNAWQKYVSHQSSQRDEFWGKFRSHCWGVCVCASFPPTNVRLPSPPFKSSSRNRCIFCRRECASREFWQKNKSKEKIEESKERERALSERWTLRALRAIEMKAIAPGGENERQLVPTCDPGFFRRPSRG